MDNVVFQPIVLPALSVTLIAAALVWSVMQGQGSGRSRRWFVVTTLPGLLPLMSFYSLAVHMYIRLGGWPDFYGTHKLPSDLVTHYKISEGLFTIGVLIAIGMPVLLALYALVPRLRSGMIYPAFCGAACWLSLFLTALAPEGFQRWWWD